MLPQGNGRDNAQNSRPNPHEFFGENIPADVRAEPTWVLWHGEWKEDGKLHKEPYQISGYHASSTKSSTWTTFDKASEYATKRNNRYGIGYVFTPESEIGGMDLDGCVDSETLEIRPWAQEIIEAANTYVEYSPSLTGVKLIGRFKLPPMSGHQKILNEETREAIEVYDRGRFFTYTGRQVPGTPDDVRNMQVAVDGILARYFAKPQQTESAPKPSRKLRELTEEEEQAAIEAIAGHLPEGHLNDLALQIACYLLRRTYRPTVERIMIAAWDAHGLIKHDGSGLKEIIRRTAERLENGERTVGGPSIEKRLPEMYEALKAALKKRGRTAAADDLVRMGLDIADELFTDQYKQPYALVDGASLPLEALGDLLAVEWFRTKNKALPQDSIKTALNTLAALARVEGKEHDLKTRWGRVGSIIYYETAPGKVWEIDSRGWRRASDPPVRFRRLDLLRPLPDPVAGGTLEDLTEVIKLQGVALRMYLSAMVSYPFENVPRPVLAIVGKQGGGKSTRTKVLKRLLDEDGSDFVSPQGDILRQATHRAVVGFDNQSSFPKDFSDLLSSLITGGGDSRRELYSNNREFAFKVMHPVVLNGINIPSDRPDLLERTLIVEVPDIRPEERETEHDFWAKFEQKRGLLLGVVFDLISGVLRNYQPLEKRPRMADWSDYASALYAHTGWGRDQFEADWETEEERQHETALDSIVGSALVDYLRSEFEPPSYKKVPEVLTKTPAALFDSVRVEVNLDARKFFPKSTSSFMRDFNRHIPALEYLGYGIWQGKRGKGKESRQVVEIWRRNGTPPNGSADKSAGSAASLPRSASMQGYENSSENGLFKGNSSATSNGPAASAAFAAFSETGGKNNGKKRKKRMRRNSPLKGKKMPADVADLAADEAESPANGYKKGLPASPENAGRLPADRDEVSADGRTEPPVTAPDFNPGGRYNMLSPEAQHEYIYHWVRGVPHAEALERAIAVDEEGEEL